MLSIISRITLVLLLSILLGQNKLVAQNDKVRLINWKALDCDNTYDPYRLINRITDFEVGNGSTLITVSFSDNCCAEFKPDIEFRKGELFLEPYSKHSGDYCDCNCCFSILYEINGLPEKKYNVYFKGVKIERSDDYYKVSEPSYEEYKGKPINRRNKYGFNEGLWITFYEDGKYKTIKQYPDSELYRESKPIWTKQFYPSGALSFFAREDTTQSWFEDGELKSQFIQYKNGDTTYNYHFRRYENRNIKSKSLERMYPTIFTSEFDPDYRAEGSASEVIFGEEFYESGRPKFTHGRDTIYSWYETGQVESIQYGKGGITYGINGSVAQRAFYWKQKGPSSWGDLRHSLYVDYNVNGKVSKVHYVRDEATKDGIASGIHYNWEWNDEMKIIKSPEKWEEAFPWEKFKEIEIFN